MDRIVYDHLDLWSAIKHTGSSDSLSRIRDDADPTVPIPHKQGRRHVSLSYIQGKFIIYRDDLNFQMFRPAATNAAEDAAT